MAVCSCLHHGNLLSAYMLCYRLLLSSESPLTEDGFIADELHVWYTEEADKSLESWHCVATFPFSGVDPFETSKEPFQED